MYNVSRDKREQYSVMTPFPHNKHLTVLFTVLVAVPIKVSTQGT